LLVHSKAANSTLKASQLQAGGQVRAVLSPRNIKANLDSYPLIPRPAVGRTPSLTPSKTPLPCGAAARSVATRLVFLGLP